MELLLAFNEDFSPIPYANLLEKDKEYYTSLFYYLKNSYRMIIDEKVYQSLAAIKGIKQDNIVLTDNWYNRKSEDAVLFLGDYPPQDYMERHSGVTVMAADFRYAKDLWQYIDTLFIVLEKREDKEDMERIYEFIAAICKVDDDFYITDIEEQNKCEIVMLRRSLVRVYRAIPKEINSKHQEFTFMTRYDKLYYPPPPLAWAEKHHNSLKDEKLRKFLTTHYKIIEIKK